MPCTTKLMVLPCKARFCHAAPVSKAWVLQGLLLCSNVFLERTTMSTAAFFVHCLVKSMRRLKKVSQCGVSFLAYKNLQGCPLYDEGAQRAASKSCMSCLSLISSPDIALGDHRSANKGRHHDQYFSGLFFSYSLEIRKIY